MNSTAPVLIVSGLSLLNPYTGQGVYTSRLIAALAREPARRFCVVGPQGVELPQGLPAENFLRVTSYSGVRPDLIRFALSSAHITRVVRDRFPDAVFHSPGPTLGRPRRLRTIVTIHDCIYRHFRAYEGRFYLRREILRATERFAARADLVLTVSQYSKGDIAAQTGIAEEKIRVVYPWVGTEFHEKGGDDAMATLRRAIRLPEDFWLYVGGYDIRKNVEFLVKAYGLAANRADLPELVLVGTIPRRRHPANCDVRSALQTLPAKVRRRIHCVGPVPAGMLPALYRAARLVVYPSLMEGFGFPPAEAMAMRTPVLSSNSSSLPEVVRKPQCRFDPCDLEELTDKLSAAVANEKQFTTELPAELTETAGLSQYLNVIREIGGDI